MKYELPVNTLNEDDTVKYEFGNMFIACLAILWGYACVTTLDMVTHAPLSVRGAPVHTQRLLSHFEKNKRYQCLGHNHVLFRRYAIIVSSCAQEQKKAHGGNSVRDARAWCFLNMLSQATNRATNEHGHTFDTCRTGGSVQDRRASTVQLHLANTDDDRIRTCGIQKKEYSPA